MSTAHDGYLENEVLSASPAKLHLLLVEGAIRKAEQARRHWQDGHYDLACESLIRAQEIVTEMTTGLNREADPQLVGRLAAVYVFIFRSLVEASLNRDEKRLDEALRILAIERDTWRAVCEKQKRRDVAGEVPPPRTGAALPPHFNSQFDSAPSSVSFEA